MITFKMVLDGYSELLEVLEDLMKSEQGKRLWSQQKRDSVYAEIVRGKKLIRRATRELQRK